MDAEFEVVEAPKERKKLLPVILISVILIAVIALILLYHAFFAPVVYRRFTEKRIALMEEIFDMTVTDDVKLLRYEDDSILIAIDETLTLTVPDYAAFLKSNLHTEIQQTEEPYSGREGEGWLYYNYQPDFCRTEVKISPAGADGMYTVILHHYE